MKTTSLIATILVFAAFSAWPQTAVSRPGVVARVALLSDTHTNRGTNGDQSLYREHLDKVIAAVNAAHVDLVLVAGDLTQDGKPGELADFRKQIKGLRAPVWFVPGNHDVGNKLLPGHENCVTAERVAAFEKTMGPSFFSRRRSGLRVIGINSPIFGGDLPREAQMWAFLERELAKPSARPTIVFMHYPAYVTSVDEPGGDYWNVEPAPRRRLLALIKRSGVGTVLSGHLHRQLINRHDGILFVTTPPVSFGLPQGKQPEGWTLVLVPAQGEAEIEFKSIPK
jgi:3',5'-cyclic AMP phosphodiesterase CpdA